MAAVRLLVTLALVASCSQPAPKPTPVQADAGVVDMFTGKIWNCRLNVVAIERDSARGDIAHCLDQWPDAEAVNACTIKQATTNYQPVTVACGVRDIGASRNAAYLAGSTDPADKAEADAARAWIYSHQLGYR